MGSDGFRGLVVWQRAKNLAVRVYRVCAEGRLASDFRLSDRLQRSAVSIASNIAEGDERGSDREAARFFFIAKGSLAELSTQIEIAKEDYLNSEVVGAVEAECVAIGKMLGALIKAPSPLSIAPRP